MGRNFTDFRIFLESKPFTFIVLLFIFIILDTKAEPFEVRLYNKAHFEGRYVKFRVTPEEPCTNLPNIWDKKIASVDPLGCIILYAEPNCKGLRRRLERWSWGSSALKDIAFENVVSSLGPCPIVKKIIIPGDDEL